MIGRYKGLEKRMRKKSSQEKGISLNKGLGAGSLRLFSTKESTRELQHGFHDKHSLRPFAIKLPITINGCYSMCKMSSIKAFE